MKQSIRTIVTALAAVLPLLTHADTWLRCGAWLDVEQGIMRGAATLVISDDRIAALHDGYPEAGGTAVVDLSDMTCLPGLMDMHTHLTQESSASSYLDRFTKNEADVALQSVVYARKTLHAGFTTVRNLGDAYNASIALRKAVDAGLIDGPRIFTAGKSIATTGGHADPTNSWRADIMGSPGPRDGVINGPDAAREAVRQRYKDGADVIKITITGGVLSMAKSGMAPQFTEEEVAAVVQTAADYGMTVAAHAHGAEGMKRAIRAGIHSIEHGTLMDDEVIKLMKQRGTWYVPTISAGKFAAAQAEIDGFYPPMVRDKARAIGPQVQETFAKAYKAGVKVAFGTDCGVCLHGDNAREFEFMVEAGMPPIEALQSATLATAELLGIREDAGSLTVGKWADVVAVPGDPLANIAVMSDVGFVMKAGRIYKQ
jgi:imidazolonepropionase-like amidohydrolase